MKKCFIFRAGRTAAIYSLRLVKEQKQSKKCSSFHVVGYSNISNILDTSVLCFFLLRATSLKWFHITHTLFSFVDADLISFQVTVPTLMFFSILFCVLLSSALPEASTQWQFLKPQFWNPILPIKASFCIRKDLKLNTAIFCPVVTFRSS